MKPDESSSIAHRIRDICEKSLQDLPVGKDVPRLAKKFRLFNIDGSGPKETSVDHGDVRLRIVDTSNDGDAHELDIDAFDERDGISEDQGEAVSFLNQLDAYMKQYLQYKNKNMSKDDSDFDTSPADDMDVNGDDHHNDDRESHQGNGNVAEDSDHDDTNEDVLVLPPIIDQITDEELEQQTVVYFLIRSMFKVLSVMTALPHATFPTLQQYHDMVNINDHTTTTEFLSEHFGDYHPLTKLLKATQQTIVINVLYLAREALMKFTPLHFKDVRGHWRVMIMYHTGAQRIVVCHKRTEEVYMKRSMQEMQQARHLGMFKTLFKFTWRVCIEFDTSNDMSIRDIRVELLDIIFSDEQHKRDYEHEVNVVKELFRQMNHSGSITLSEHESVKILNQREQQNQKAGNSNASSSSSTTTRISPSISSLSDAPDNGDSSSNKVSRGFSVLHMFRDLFSGSQRSDSMSSLPSARADRGNSQDEGENDKHPRRQRSGTSNDGFFKRLFSRTGSGSSSASTGTGSEQSKEKSPEMSEDAVHATNVDTESMSSPEGSTDMDVERLEEPHKQQSDERGRGTNTGHHHRNRTRSVSRAQSSRSLYHERKRRKSKRRKR